MSVNNIVTRILTTQFTGKREFVFNVGGGSFSIPISQCLGELQAVYSEVPRILADNGLYDIRIQVLSLPWNSHKICGIMVTVKK